MPLLANNDNNQEIRGNSDAQQPEEPSLPERVYRPYQQSSLFEIVQIALNEQNGLPSLMRKCKSPKTAETASVLDTVNTLIAIFKACEEVTKIESLISGRVPGKMDSIRLIGAVFPLKTLLEKVGSQIQALAQTVTPKHIEFFTLLLAIVQAAPIEPNDFQRKLIPFVNKEYLISTLNKTKLKTIEAVESNYSTVLKSYLDLATGYLARVNSPSITPLAPVPASIPASESLDVLPVEVIDDPLATRRETFEMLRSANEAVMMESIKKSTDLSVSLEHLESDMQDALNNKVSLSATALQTLPAFCELARVEITVQERQELEVLKTEAMLPNAANHALILAKLEQIKCSTFLRNVYDIICNESPINATEFFAKINALNPGDNQPRKDNYKNLVRYLFAEEGELRQELEDLGTWVFLAPSKENIKTAKLRILAKFNKQYPEMAPLKTIESAIELHQAEDRRLASDNRNYADIESILADISTVRITASKNQVVYHAIIEALEAAERLEQASDFSNINLVTALIEKLNTLAFLEVLSPEQAQQVQQTQIKCDVVLASHLNKAVNNFDVLLPVAVCTDANYVVPYRSYLNNATLVGWINSRAPSIPATAGDFISFTNIRDVLLKKIRPPANVQAVVESENNASTCYNFFLKVMAQPAHKKIVIGLMIVGVLALIASGTGIGLIAGAGIAIGVSLLTVEIVAGAGAASCAFGGALGFFGGYRSRGAPPAITVTPEATVAP